MTKKMFVNLVLVLALLLPPGLSAVNAAPLAQEQTYTVKLGDNLWTLAEKYLGSGPAYHAIVIATNLKSVEDPTFAKIKNANLIHPGWKLLIPSAEEAEELMKLIYYAGVEEQELMSLDLPDGYELPEPRMDYTVYLEAETFQPPEEVDNILQSIRDRGRDRTVVLIQFWDIPDGGIRAWLSEVGISLLAYVPNYAWFAAVRPDVALEGELRDFTRAVMFIEEDWIVAPEIREEGIADYAIDDDGNAILWLMTFPDIAEDEARAFLEGLDAEQVLGPFNPATWVLVTSDWPMAIDRLKAWGGVMWIDQASPPKEPNNDGARVAANVNPLLGPRWGLSGFGIHVGIWEAGNIAAGPGKVDPTHPDLAPRVVAIDLTTTTDHATHVAGTIGGTGIADALVAPVLLFFFVPIAPSQWMGMAPASALYSWDTAAPWLPAEMYLGIVAQSLDLINNSWGNGPPFGIYSPEDVGYDMIHSGTDLVTWFLGWPKRERRPLIFSAGNHGILFPGMGNINLDGGSGKDVITVGATNSDNLAMPGFSSWGPTADWRTKPDVVAPGAESDLVVLDDRGIVSSIPMGVFEDEYNNPACAGPPDFCDDYAGPYNNPFNVVVGDCFEGCYEGTSMAAAVTSGVVALLTEQYNRAPVFGPRALPSTYKALLAGTAIDLVANPAGPALLTGPDFVYGYGHIDALAAAAALDVTQRIAPVVQQGNVANRSVAVHALFVPQGVDLQVTLVWDDFPGAPFAVPALVNDLDLILFDPTGVPFLQWSPPLPPALGPATVKWDGLNPIEQVKVPAASNPGGVWRAVVVGSVVPFGPQDYSLVFFW
jgi:hypothetical protein